MGEKKEESSGRNEEEDVETETAMTEMKKEEHGASRFIKEERSFRGRKTMTKKRTGVNLEELNGGKGERKRKW